MINLYINLLLDSERRSSSRISRVFFIGAVLVLAAFSFLTFVIVALVGGRLAEQTLRFTEQQKKQLEQPFRSVSALQQELAGLQDLTNAVASWSRTRPDWPVLLFGIQAIVPPTIQFTRMMIDENICTIDNAPVRKVTLHISGKAGGEHSEVDVQQLQSDFMEKPFLREAVELAEVKQFEAARNENQSDLRVFNLECRFKALKLHQPAPPKPPEKKDKK